MKKVTRFFIVPLIIWFLIYTGIYIILTKALEAEIYISEIQQTMIFLSLICAVLLCVGIWNVIQSKKKGKSMFVGILMITLALMYGLIILPSMFRY